MAAEHAPRVRIAFLDTGYDPKHAARPAHINPSLARNFVEDKISPDGSSLIKEPGLAGSQSHGTGTLGILAGQAIELVDHTGKTLFNGELGGAPFAEIAPMRVATWVVHVENPIPLIKTRPSATSRAILYAARNHCDVISMSHGGLPSRALADAINTAYESGVAMFFASGDYLQPVHLQPPYIPISGHSPRYVVFPAAFPRTMCVCGITADFKTCGKPPNERYDPALGPVDSWRLRGNWGPPAWMKNAIATFSPNILWPHLPNPKVGEAREDVIDLDGQGTSAATPQAAAAAALWLQYYREDDKLKRNWHNWRKAESVYRALRTSAKRIDDPSDQKYSENFFGNGVLKASDALAKQPQDVPDAQKQGQARVGLGWMRLFESTIGGTRDAGTSEDILKQMLALELLQLTQRSAKLQEVMDRYGGFDPDAGEDLAPEKFASFRREIFDAVKDDTRASRHLKEAVLHEKNS